MVASTVAAVNLVNRLIKKQEKQRDISLLTRIMRRQHLPLMAKLRHDHQWRHKDSRIFWIHKASKGLSPHALQFHEDVTGTSYFLDQWSKLQI